MCGEKMATLEVRDEGQGIPRSVDALEPFLRLSEGVREQVWDCTWSLKRCMGRLWKWRTQPSGSQCVGLAPRALTQVLP